jgi:6-phospho-3-hexuloisomerase
VNDATVAVAVATRRVLDELTCLADSINWRSAEAAATMLTSAERVYFTGTGRSGLAARAIAMRLMHIGLRSYVVGEVATPAITAGDLLVALSATGSGAVTALAVKARSNGAGILAVTADAHGELARAAHETLIIPARTRVASTQHAGSLFEQGCLIIGDALCSVIQRTLAVPDADLDSRHANLP